MENISQMSLLEVAIELMESKEGKVNISELIKEVLALKGLTDENGELTAKLYLDITKSSKFVYMGENEWDLKSRQSLDEYDKDGSAFNSKDDYEEDEDDLDEDDLDDLDDEDLDDEDEDDEDSDDDSDDEDEDDEDSDDEYEDDLDEDSLDDEDDSSDDSDFNEDKYNDYMDDYEDMYEDK